MAERRKERRSPSDLVEHVAHGGAGQSRAIAMRRGEAIHAVLERSLDVANARDFLASNFSDLPADSLDGMIAEVAAVYALPAAARLFGPDALSEVTVSIDLPTGGPRMIGRIDRLLVTESRVLLVDFKTDAMPPVDAGQVQDAYLAQLGAYVSAVAAEYPDIKIDPAILWTAAPRLDLIPSHRALTAFHAGAFSA